MGVIFLAPPSTGGLQLPVEVAAQERNAGIVHPKSLTSGITGLVSRCSSDPERNCHSGSGPRKKGALHLLQQYLFNFSCQLTKW